MGVRYAEIRIDYVQDFSRGGTLVLPLTIDDQRDPRLLALLEWHRAHVNAKIAAEGPADPFALG